MRNISIILLLSLDLLLTGCATLGGGRSWKCNANGLEDSYYSGGDSAFIHLLKYSTGAEYPVKLNEDKTEATGKTDDGTPFTCTKIK